ncbi:UNVERIFIED_CONTAM: hypothetical protein H355_007548 [Colinus virginianus]|nr:hypothetical protein H355_007548 [Colinus virginianus]
MEPRPPAWPLLSLLLLLCPPCCPGVGAQSYTDFKLLQPQGPVVVTTGETLTLNCTASGWGPVGPVKWLKGWGDGNETIYDQKGSFPPRVMRVVEESSTDFTIRIRDVRIEDAGTYYCVKFRKDTFGDVFFQRGGGTEVLVLHEPEKSSGTTTTQKKTLLCHTQESDPNNLTYADLNFAKEKKSIRRIIELSPVSYTHLDVYKRQAHHVGGPADEDVRAGPGPASVSVAAAPPGAVEVNKTVNFTCRVQGFYPGAVSVSWLENGTEMNAGSTPQPTETSRGLFELKSTVTVQAGEEKNGSRFTCRVLHEDQEPIFSTGTLRVAATAQWDPNDGSTGDSKNLIYVAVGVVCTVLVLLVIAILYLIWTKQSKGKDKETTCVAWGAAAEVKSEF